MAVVVYHEAEILARGMCAVTPNTVSRSHKAICVLKRCR